MPGTAWAAPQRPFFSLTTKSAFWLGGVIVPIAVQLPAEAQEIEAMLPNALAPAGARTAADADPAARAGLTTTASIAEVTAPARRWMSVMIARLPEHPADPGGCPSQ
jgi:hypothetical protein